MVQKLEHIKGGGGSIRVGTTGTIGSLMTKELDSMRFTSQKPISTQRNPSTVAVSCGDVSSPKKLKPRKMTEDLSSGGSSSSSSSNRSINCRYPECTKKTGYNISKKALHAPMLGADDASIQTTPNREKANKRSNFVEIVDIKCGHPDKWSSPFASRFKKLSFSRLSETIN